VNDGIRVERVEGEGWLVSIRGEHDLTTAPMLSQTFEPLFASGAFVDADIREVTFLDSQTLGVFASAIERAATRAATDLRERFALVVDVEQSHLRRVLEIARPIMGDVPTYPSRDAALEALRDRYI
jgi:anti-anti-sigma regulatory factor